MHTIIEGLVCRNIDKAGLYREGINLGLGIKGASARVTMVLIPLHNNNDCLLFIFIFLYFASL